MEERELDELTRRLARPVPRRTVLRAALAAALGGMASLATLGKASDQTATCGAVGSPCSPAGQYGPECCSGYCTSGGTCGCPAGRVYCPGSGGETPGCVTPCLGGQVLVPTTCTCECPHGTSLCKGTCTRACPPGQTFGPACACACPGGVCGTGGGGTCCASGTTCCAGSCANLQMGGAGGTNCGTCGTTCTGTRPACCGGTCADLATSVASCGACGNACQGGMTCQSGTCACPAGTALCGGVCAANGSLECGGTCCTGGACCVNGTCTGSCPNGQPCVNGACGLTCPTGGMCQGLAAAGCPSGCSCATTAEGKVTCVIPPDSGLCTPPQCNTTADCPTGSACIPLNSTFCSCGGTNKVCYPVCSQCPSGQTNINGTCCPQVRVCGTSCCTGGMACSNGTCCPQAQVCGTACCADGQTCSSGICCPSGQTSINGACCPQAQVCGYNCCAASQCCIDSACYDNGTTVAGQTCLNGRLWAPCTPDLTATCQTGFRPCSGTACGTCSLTVEGLGTGAGACSAEHFCQSCTSSTDCPVGFFCAYMPGCCPSNFICAGGCNVAGPTHVPGPVTPNPKR
ncbi:MAG: hypothetical protein JOZ41_02195 [Chloroflexi bacterium]|nr:hypothetical protein [Chloroflexota bacterium]